MTEQLYYTDPKKVEFAAQVIETGSENDRWFVVLDKTCFYPGGGGQPADKGWLKDLPVLEVRKQGDTIYHYLPGNPGTGAITGKVDPDWRRDFMQQHTGQHIISGALWKIGQYKTLSVHMGIDYTSIEIDARDIPADDLIQVEKLANQVIRLDLPVDFILTHDRDLDRFPLRKPGTRKGTIRLVRVGDFDCVACGGLHVASSREVVLVKAIGSEKIRDHARISWKIGDRALNDYHNKDKIISQLKAVLATNEDSLVHKLNDLQDQLSLFKKNYSGLETRLADATAQDLYNSSYKQVEQNFRIITASWQDENENLLKKIIKNLLKREKVLFCLLNEQGNQVQWSIGCSADVMFSFHRVEEELLPIIAGKGGGRSPLWQGIGKKPQGSEDFLTKFIGTFG